jgi:hypothetical protein
MSGITLGRTIWLKDPGDETVLAHELVHAQQQKADGFWTFLLRYVFSMGWRMAYEGEAYAESVRRGERLEFAAQLLSGPLYFWPCSREEAENEIAKWLP